MRFTVSIECDNEAFADGNCGLEVQRILARLAANEPSPGEEFTLKDINGNTVGQAKYSPAREVTKRQAV